MKQTAKQQTVTAQEQWELVCSCGFEGRGSKAWARATVTRHRKQGHAVAAAKVEAR